MPTNYDETLLDRYAREARIEAKIVAKIKLEERATELWPESQVLREKWLAAVAYLLGRNKWVLYGGAVKWRDE